MIAKEKGVLVDSLQKQEDRDAQGRFLKGRSGNPEGRFLKGRSGNPKGRPAGARNRATQTAERGNRGLSLKEHRTMAIARTGRWPDPHRTPARC